MQPARFAGFANPAIPQRDEVRSWAYDPTAGAPEVAHQWDLILASDELAPTLVQLAADPVCPKRTFSLHCLYVYSADAVRTGFRAHSRRRVQKLLEQAEDTGDQWVALWAHNTMALIRRPDLFDYHEWCTGGLVRTPRRIA